MKYLSKITIVTTCLLMAATSFAADYSPSNSLRVKKKKSRSAKKYGFNFYTFYSGADDLSTTSNSNYNNRTTNFNNATYAVPLAALTGQYSTSTSVGIGAEYAKPKIFRLGRFKFGASGGATYEFDRTINRDLIRNTYITTTNNRAIVDNATDPNLNLVLPYINFTITRRASYFFTGVNYSMPEMSDAGKEDYNGDMGYQVGFGTRINSWIALEAAYRVVNFSASPNFEDLLTTTNNQLLNVNTIQVEERRGLGILSDEDLSLSGFTLSLRISI